MYIKDPKPEFSDVVLIFCSLCYNDYEQNQKRYINLYQKKKIILTAILSHFNITNIFHLNKAGLFEGSFI